MSKKSLEQSAELMRHLLGSFDLSDIEKLRKEGLTDIESRARASDVEIFFMKHFEKVLKLFIQAQLEWIANDADDEYKLQFGRGSINGLFLVRDWFADRIKESTARFQKDEKPVPGESIPPKGKLET